MTTTNNTTREERITKFQISFIEECKKQFLASSKNGNKSPIFVYDPDSSLPKGNPKVGDGYIKPVIFMVPHLQFEFTDCLICKEKLKTDGFHQTYRQVQGLSCCSSLVQFRYHCECNARKVVTSYELLHSNRVPEYMALYYPVTATKRSMVHNDLLTFLFSDNLTGKSFFKKRSNYINF